MGIIILIFVIYPIIGGLLHKFHSDDPLDCDFDDNISIMVATFWPITLFWIIGIVLWVHIPTLIENLKDKLKEGGK